MVDTRFHPFAGAIPLLPLLRAAGLDGGLADPRAGDRVVGGASELIAAGPADIALAAHRDYLAELRDTAAGAVIVARALVEAVPSTAIAVPADDPHGIFAAVLERLYPRDTRMVLSGQAPQSARPHFEQGVTLGANVVIGDGVEIGSGTLVGPNTVIGPGVAIGRDCVIGANCTIDCAYIGNRVVVHPGARIGTEGFGWLDLGRSNRKIPQLGRVILQDGVEIGANTTVDRGALGDTVIGEGTKVDNVVQIGHNCRIGRNCLIAAMVGLSGSTVLEDGVMLGGGAATAGHLTIGRGSVIYAWGGVTKDVPPGSRLAGFPAEDVRIWRREVAALRGLTKRGEG